MDLDHDIAGAILDGFNKHYRIFREAAVAAKGRFERAEWTAVRAASRERIDLYDARVQETVASILERFPAARTEESVWPRVKRAYIALLYNHRQPECAETFFNSVACRVLDRTYYRNEYIFWRPAVSTDFVDADQPTYRCYYPAEQGLRPTLHAIIRDFDFQVPFADLGRDLRLVVRALREHLPAPRVRHANLQVQVLSSLFFRNTGAYMVGRVINGADEHPFAVSLRHVKGGGALCVDALLLTSADIGRVFSLSRAYFTVDMEVPSAFVAFLRHLMPTFSAGELYTAVGLQKQGKTLFYRDLFEHLKHSGDRFVIAPGVRGLVMVVFTLPSFPYVFKLIRDTFRPPKQTTRAEVRRKYVYVKHHDRVGRMADTLEYADVAFPVARIDPALLAELKAQCGAIIDHDGDRVIIRHLYIERRMTPLDVFLADADDEQARAALGDYGRALRELAEAGVFPGDLLCKNFGVTRAGRVVFYDYDEVSPLTEVTFRRLPAPRNDDDELSSEPWFPVGAQDVFPEEWPTFLFRNERDRALFLRLHPELVDPGWWAARQADVRAGTIADVYPYPQELRFVTRYAGVT
jgi:isocitrate dehydrogenase kinase/phosphatase